MKNTLLPITCAMALAASAGLSVAAEQATTFEQFDRDGNGYISMDEAQAGAELSSNFKATDKNGDGQLDISEFSAFEGQGRLSPPEESEVPEPGAAPY